MRTQQLFTLLRVFNIQANTNNMSSKPRKPFFDIDWGKLADDLANTNRRSTKPSAIYS